jgi:hypothetical protein
LSLSALCFPISRRRARAARALDGNHRIAGSGLLRRWTGGSCIPCFIPQSVLAAVRGVVHDPQHRPIADATVTLHAANSDFVEDEKTNTDGEFSFSAVPAGVYIITAAQPGFDTAKQSITVASNTSPVLHFELAGCSVQQSVTVDTNTSAANVDSITPTTLISREDIARTPGADRTNSMAMITDYVPGAYMTHDMLHMRGGHELSWLIDGVNIPNTNIASNIAPQIDPKDIDYLEVDRGSYRAAVGDRTYGVFDVVPRSGFERNRQGELVLTRATSIRPTTSSAWATTRKNSPGTPASTAIAATMDCNRRSRHRFIMPAMAMAGSPRSIYNHDPANQMRLVTQLRTDYYQIPYDPDQDDWQNQLYDSSGLRDGEHETDGYAALTWVHNFNASTVLQLSPFYHYNDAKYDPSAQDLPTATSSNQTGNYAGVQSSLSTVIAKNSISGGVYAYGQHEHDVLAWSSTMAAIQEFYPAGTNHRRGGRGFCRRQL